MSWAFRGTKAILAITESGFMFPILSQKTGVQEHLSSPLILGKKKILVVKYWLIKRKERNI